MLETANNRKQRCLEDSCKQHIQRCEVRDLLVWMNDKEAITVSSEVGDDLGQVDGQQKKFADFPKDLAANKATLTEIIEISTAIHVESSHEVQCVAACIQVSKCTML